MPFRVKINNSTEVEVLGTHFNINAYADEASINTTLLEGSVRVTANKKVQLLSPGQQAQVNASAINLIKDADVAQAVAWKDGLFAFTDADVPTVMRQLARWYDVEVKYEGAIPEKEFNGKMHLMEYALHAGYALIKAWKGDTQGNLIYRHTARNFNPVMAMAGKITIAEVEELVEVGELDPDNIHTPGIYVHRIFEGKDYEKRIENRTVTKKV